MNTSVNKTATEVYSEREREREREREINVLDELESERF